MIDTEEYYGGTYPEPPEIEENNITGTLIITYHIDADVPKKWDKKDILEDIKQNLTEYISLSDYEDIEIDV